MQDREHRQTDRNTHTAHTGMQTHRYILTHTHTQRNGQSRAATYDKTCLQQLSMFYGLERISNSPEKKANLDLGTTFK